MTHLDIIATVLSDATGQTIKHWRGVVLATLAAKGVDIANDTKLLTVLPQAEADDLLTRLRAPANKMGVLSWLVQGAMLSRHATPQDLHTFNMYQRNQQN